MRTMRVLLVACTALLSWAAGVVPAGASDLPVRTYKESFERDFGGWMPDSDGKARAWRVERTPKLAADGFFSLEYYVDGRDDDGTVWVERAFPVPAGTPLNVTVTFQLNGPAPDLTGWPVVAYAGADNPAAEADFTIIGRAGEVTGWAKYGHKTRVVAPKTGMIWIAVGISVTWETIRTHYLDLVEVTIARAYP
jgi:hypothetical protein